MKSSQSSAALRALCALGLHAEALVPAFLEALHGLVPSYRNLFDWTDEQGRLARYFVEGPIDAAVARLYFEEFHNRRDLHVVRPFEALRRMPAGVLGADELDHADFYASAYYNEIWRPQGFRTRLQAIVRGRDGQLLGSLVLYRAPGEPRFGAHDERRLAAVLPGFAAALQTGGPAGLQPGADESHVPSPEPPETLLLTLQGEVCHASPGAARLLLMAEGGPSRETLSRPMNALAGRLLPALTARLKEQLAGDAATEAQRRRSAPPAITHVTSSGHYVAHGRLLRPHHPDGEALVQVTLRRLEPHRVALERALRALPLTPGQTAVCRQLYRGHAHGVIGAQLGVAPATVVDHVRKLYRALDVHSTLELRARLDSLMAVG
jgi:DNA-binding CsgD family transcriptional regulator